jgi:hypothetical protein
MTHLSDLKRIGAAWQTTDLLELPQKEITDNLSLDLSKVHTSTHSQNVPIRFRGSPLVLINPPLIQTGKVWSQEYGKCKLNTPRITNRDLVTKTDQGYVVNEGMVELEDISPMYRIIQLVEKWVQDQVELLKKDGTIGKKSANPLITLKKDTFFPLASEHFVGIKFAQKDGKIVRCLLAIDGKQLTDVPVTKLNTLIPTGSQFKSQILLNSLSFHNAGISIANEVTGVYVKSKSVTADTSVVDLSFD